MDTRTEIQTLIEMVSEVNELSHFINKLTQLTDFAGSVQKVLVISEQNNEYEAALGELFNIKDPSLFQTNTVPIYMQYGQRNEVIVQLKNGQQLTQPFNETAFTMTSISQNMMDVQQINVQLQNSLLKNSKFIILPKKQLLEAAFMQTIDEVLYYHSGDDKLAITELPVLEFLNEHAHIPTAVISAKHNTEKVYEALMPHIKGVIWVDEVMHHFANQPAPNEEMRNMRLKKSLQNILTELLESVAKLPKSPRYIRALEALKKTSEQQEQARVKKADAILMKIANTEQVLDRQAQSMEQPKQFLHWVKDAKRSIEGVSIADWRTLAKDYEELREALTKLQAQIEQYNRDAESVLGSATNVFWRLGLPGAKIHLLKEKYKGLKAERRKLVAKTNELAPKFNQVEGQLRSLNGQIYEQEKKRYLQIQQQLKDEVNEIQTNNKAYEQSIQTVLENMKFWDVLVELEVEIAGLANDLGMYIPRKYSEQPHHYMVQQIEMQLSENDGKLNALNDKIHGAPNWHETFTMPPALPIVSKPNRYFFTNYKGAAGTAIVGAVCVSGYFAFQSLKDFEFPKKEETAQGFTEQNESEKVYLGFDEDYVEAHEDNIVGTLYAYENLELYDAYEGVKQEEQLEAQTVWDVYEVADDWLRIQNNLWVNTSKFHQSYFEPNIYEPYITDQIVLGSVYVESEGTTIYKEPNGELRMQQLESGRSYDVSIMTESGWLKIGQDAWILYDKTMALTQMELESRLHTNATPIQSGSAKKDFIPVFNKPDRGGDIVGYMMNRSDLLIYETVNADWVNIGDNAWVEAEKYLNIDWQYVDYNEGYDPIGYAEVLVNVLNVRTAPNQEASLRGILNKGMAVEVYEIDPQTGWYLIGQDAWISEKPAHVQYSPVEEEVDEETPASNNESIGYIDLTTIGIKVHDAPDENANVIEELSIGQYYEVYGVSSDEKWIKLGENRWIENDPNDYYFYSY